MKNTAAFPIVKKNGKKSQTFFAITARRLSRNGGAMAGLGILVIIVIMAVLAPWIMPYSYSKIDILNAFAKPSLLHLLGTDELGRDILSRIMFGARYSLQIAILSTLIGLVGGTIIGAISGYFGGKIDNTIMRIFDVIQAIPHLLFAITVSTALGSGFTNLLISLGITSIPMYARILRAQILSVRETEYVEAAIAINCSVPRIIANHVFPNAMTPLIVQAAMGVAQQILAAATLSFVGLGVQPPTPEWGAMLTAGRAYIRDYPHIVFFPGFMIMLTVLSLNKIGDGLRDAIDPKLKR